MSIPLVGSPPPAKPDLAKTPPTELLTGDSSLFSATVGSWTATGSGASVAFSAASSGFGFDSKHGACKLTATTPSGRYASVPVAGTFLNGHVYHALVMLYHAAPANTTDAYGYHITFGDMGASDFKEEFIEFLGSTASPITSGGFQVLPAIQHVAILLPWLPGASRSSVTIRVERYTGTTQSTDIYITRARVIEVLNAGQGLSGPVGQSSPNSSGKGAIMLPFQSTSYTGIGIPARNNGPGFRGLQLSPATSIVVGPPDDNNDESYLSASYAGMVIYGNQRSGIGRRAVSSNYEGVDEELGPDYVGWIRSERSSTEVEMAPDGDYDIFLLDGSTNSDVKHWWHEEADPAAWNGSVGRRSRVGSYFQETFRFTGTQSTGTAKNEQAQYLQTPYPVEFDEVRVHIGTAPTGQAFIVDVNIAGTTIFGTQANRPQVAAGTNDATSGAPDTTTYAKNSRLSIDFDQVGSGTAGADVTVMVRGRYLW